MSQSATLVNQNAIAERLNLSVATVSRALRSQPGIHPSTRSRVLEAAAELGYQPLRNHRSKTTSQANYIGVFVRSVRPDMRPTYLVGMANLASQLNLSLVLHHTPLQEPEVLLDPQRQPPALRDGTLAGAVLVHRWPANVVRYLCDRMVCVSIIHQVPGIPMDTVDMDHAHGMALMARHLYQLGHRRIGFFGLCGELDWSRATYGGYAEALCELGLPMDPCLVVPAPTNVLEDCNARPDEVVNHAVSVMRQHGVTAFMAASHWAATFLSRAMTERGIKIPDDLSITGFDDSDRLPGVNITSTRIDTGAMGAEALHRVTLRLAEPRRPQQVISFSCSLVVGESVAAPKSLAK
jgi:DNA-binding LacI/PurR family transcriptional regulator